MGISKFLLVLLGVISKDTDCKAHMASSGIVPTIVDVTHRFATTRDAAECGVSCLANLTFESKSNMDLIMQANGVPAIEKVMQSFPDEVKILEVVLVALSNLMFESDENKRTIGLRCGDEITDIVR